MVYLLPILADVMNADGLDGDSSDRRQDLGPRCHFRLLTLRLFRFLSFHGWMIGHGPSSFSTPMVLSTFTCLIHSTFHALLSFVSTCWPYLKFLSKRHLASPRKVPFDSAICWFVSAKRKFKNAKKEEKPQLAATLAHPGHWSRSHAWLTLCLRLECYASKASRVISIYPGRGRSHDDHESPKI